MRSRGVSVLTVIGVLASGAAAMAVNADTFGSSNPPNGNATTVLVPGVNDTSNAPEPSAEPTDVPLDDLTPATEVAPPPVAPRYTADPSDNKPSSAPAPRPKKTEGADDHDDEDEYEDEDEDHDEDEDEDESEDEDEDDD